MQKIKSACFYFITQILSALNLLNLYQIVITFGDLIRIPLPQRFPDICSDLMINMAFIILYGRESAENQQKIAKFHQNSQLYFSTSSSDIIEKLKSGIH